MPARPLSPAERARVVGSGIDDEYHGTDVIGNSTLHTARLRLPPSTTRTRDPFRAAQQRQSARYWDAPPWSDVCARGSSFDLPTDRRGGHRDALAWTVFPTGVHRLVCLTRWNPDFRSASMATGFDDAAWGPRLRDRGRAGVVQWAFDTWK